MFIAIPTHAFQPYAGCGVSHVHTDTSSTERTLLGGVVTSRLVEGEGTLLDLGTQLFANDLASLLDTHMFNRKYIKTLSLEFENDSQKYTLREHAQ